MPNHLNTKPWTGCRILISSAFDIMILDSSRGMCRCFCTDGVTRIALLKNTISDYFLFIAYIKLYIVGKDMFLPCSIFQQAVLQ